ncbi:hypothetical protein [Saccharicrinis aurantiacus]|uniref:hypothetical protein n=1 Tax=Saccharicrinis aurantiacus TaxID=1849719 RepID=UPI00249280F3|nr:hypothetical protein [Saccharicrinis aurantiacus]
MKFTFIKNQQHRVFNYKPVFYDEAKEELDERKRAVREELGLDKEDDGSTHADRIKGKMNRRMQQTTFDVSRKEKRKSTLRIVVIIAILLMFFYYLLYSSSEWILEYL